MAQPTRRWSDELRTEKRASGTFAQSTEPYNRVTPFIPWDSLLSVLTRITMQLSDAASVLTAEHILVLMLLFVCVIYVGRVVFSFRDLGLSVTRGGEATDAGGDISDHEE